MKPLPKAVVLVMLATLAFAIVGLTAIRWSVEPQLAALPQRPSTISLALAWCLAAVEWSASLGLGLYGWTGAAGQRRTLLWLLGAALAEGGFLVGWLASMGQPFPSILGFAAGALALLLAVYLPFGLTLSSGQKPSTSATT
ncbi:MAG: hypothetical protein N2109_03030 [Fimbriimonadales bacterium]|nr:hypothetical protein [Fimbriimonadales bacterium]